MSRFLVMTIHKPAPSVPPGENHLPSSFSICGSIAVGGVVGA